MASTEIPAARDVRGNGRKARQEVKQMAEERKSLSGLTEQEAQEFGTLYTQGFAFVTVVAIFAHALVWAWRPWLQ
ncbi:light-harvesting antenna LH1, beta subunit [Rhodocyclus gracilis]|nr:light-harvesting antenna LH1, beta subunit [Rhodocyclus gracilis]